MTKHSPAGQTLDLRDLPAPEPLEAALGAAEALRGGESFVALTPRVPALLLVRLRERGFAVQATEEADGSGRIAVSRPSGVER